MWMKDTSETKVGHEDRNILHTPRKGCISYMMTFTKSQGTCMACPQYIREQYHTKASYCSGNALWRDHWFSTKSSGTSCASEHSSSLIVSIKMQFIRCTTLQVGNSGFSHPMHKMVCLGLKFLVILLFKVLENCCQSVSEHQTRWTPA